ncbi:MAG: RNA-binding protein, partial [Halohasta sp.]
MSDDATSYRVRLRGIYTTALTRLCLDAGWQVVQASGPIERRFEESFGTDPHDVAIETTADRQGVGVHGASAAVDAVADRVADVAIDALRWVDPAPEGAVFDGRVIDTTGRGAVVDLGDSEGYLPFRRVDGHIETGDAVRVQVEEAAPPWTDDRPLVDTTIEVAGGLVTLVPGDGEPTVDTRDESAARELVGMTDLLGVEAPDGWRIRWAHAATEASMDALEAALDRTADRAADLSTSLGTDGLDGGLAAAGDEPAELAAPAAGAWLWFGRESRFALDEIRREVTTTMSGHHRIKAGSSGASAGVDFVEALCAPDGTFPFETVADTFGPAVGDSVEIRHGKPAGHCISLGSGTVTDRDGDSLTVRRELSGGGTYDGLGVDRERGDTATTTFR